MTVIKQKAVSSSRHAKNVRKYINGKDALARGGWNLPYNKYWYAKMARTRKSFGHDKPARAGAKNTIMYHQVLAFLPEECSCNGGKMTPDACMAYAEQWLAKHYPHQQVMPSLTYTFHLLTRVTNAMVSSKTSVKKNAPGRAE